MISITNLHKTYGKKANAYEALRGLSFDVKEGSSVAIIGKSGSGKSTLMHLMAGLDTPTEGSIQLDDTSLAGLREGRLAKLRNEKFGFIFQQFFLQPQLTVLENVVLPLKIKGVSKGLRERRAKEVIEEVGLTDKLKNRATDLSGGQKQRVAIARALVNEPQVIFADEPTGNLDSETSEAVMQLLFKLQKEKGITLIIVTHDPDIAARCQHILRIKDGTLVSTGAESKEEPKKEKN